LGQSAAWWRAGSTLVVGCALFLSPAGANARGTDQASGTRATANEFKIACSRSFEESQRLRNNSQYIAASEEVLKCADPKCGEALFDECTKIYGELQTATPSVVFAARDGAGNELTGVSVSIDGQPTADPLDGKPVRVDPGSHQFSFSSAGYDVIEQTLLIRAGEQYRPINATMQQTAVAGAPPSVATPAPASSGRSRRGAPLASYVLGGIGVVGLGTFVAFRVLGASQFEDLERNCKPNCTASEVDNVRQKYLISDIALGVGAAAAVAAVTVYLVSSAERSPRVSLQLSPSPHALGAHVGGTF